MILIVIYRSDSIMSETRTDYYGYNDRSELVSGTKDTAATNLTEYAYQYDDIGNRLSSLDLGTNRTYTANALNQYTNIVECAGGFLPQFDDDGNQTLIKTATGLWQVTYNGENRPVLWECGSTNITMKFDRMGRRVEYVEMVSGVTNTHHRFVYDGYLCIQRLNAAANNSIDLVFGWDPSEPVATRPLILQKYGQYNLFYTHDGNKNVSELVFFQQANGIAAHYEYAPFGAVTAASRTTPVTAYDFRDYNPFRFSSEYADDAFGLLYYNFRHFNVYVGKWIMRDPYWERAGRNIYIYLDNSISSFDRLGLKKCRSKIPRQGYEPQVNGCGAQDGASYPNSYFGLVDFTECCNNHDRCYGTCGSNKSQCDSNLSNCMKKACDEYFSLSIAWHERAICRMMASIYGLAVGIGGGDAYEKAQDDACEESCSCE